MNKVDLIDRDGDDNPMLRAGSNKVKDEVGRIPGTLRSALNAWEAVPRVYRRRRRELINGGIVWVYEAS